MKSLEKLQKMSLNRKTIPLLLKELTLDELKLIGSTGANRDIKWMARGQYKKLNREINVKKAVEEVKSYSISINAAAKKYRMATNFIRDALIDEGFDYDWKKVNRVDQSNNMLDRLHYHRWDKKVEIKKEFFTKLSEM